MIDDDFNFVDEDLLLDCSRGRPDFGSQSGSWRKRSGGDERFEELKIRMVMKIRGLSRSDAELVVRHLK